MAGPLLLPGRRGLAVEAVAVERIEAVRFRIVPVQRSAAFVPDVWVEGAQPLRGRRGLVLGEHARADGRGDEVGDLSPLVG